MAFGVIRQDMNIMTVSRILSVRLTVLFFHIVYTHISPNFACITGKNVLYWMCVKFFGKEVVCK